MDYKSAQEFISKTAGLGSRLGLDSIKELLARLGKPQDKLRVIHVAGTNGKGSTCAFMEYGYRQCGYRVGRYISPTLFTYLERYQINGENMSMEQFAALTDIVSNACNGMVADGMDHPTVFEVETAIAFLYFLQEKVDMVILETGMGGAEDATNVVQKPLATVFASISYDHMDFLGETIEEIARCKAGIMREGVPVICANMPVIESMGKMTCAFETLAVEAKKHKAPIYDANEYVISENINISLSGGFQRDNMAAALLTFDVLKEVLPGKRSEYIAGLESTKWPGRYETISTNPRIIRDGAHNPDAVKRLREAVETDESITDKVHLIMGVYADKDYHEEIKIIAPIAKSFTAITSPNKERALDGRVLASTAAGILTNIPVSYKDSLKEAVDAICASKEDTILIFGSLSLAILTEELINSGFLNTPERI